jgi:hypothetical protein
MILDILQSQKDTIFGLSFYDSEDTIKLIIRFMFNTSVIALIVRWLYYSGAKRKDYLFTYLIVGTVVFLLCFLLDNVKLQLGLALGLFAIFGIIRYRTNQIPIKEMTYLFLIIGISVINALANKKISYTEILLTNGFIILITWFLEKVWMLKHVSRKTIIYENIDLIKPEKRSELLIDLTERTGLNITRIEIGRINFLNDTARVRIYYIEDDNSVNLADELENFANDNDD